MISAVIFSCSHIASLSLLLALQCLRLYQAENADAALAALEAFEAGEWGQKYPAIAKSWRRQWEQVTPFFAFSAPIRRAIYTTNAVESLNSTV